jgi:hypothetical protein
LTNQKYWAATRSNLLHSFLEVHNCVAPFTSHGKVHEFGAEKPISWAKLAHFACFAINFTVKSHILSTSGDALTYVYISFHTWQPMLGAPHLLAHLWQMTSSFLCVQGSSILLVVSSLLCSLVTCVLVLLFALYFLGMGSIPALFFI